MKEDKVIVAVNEETGERVVFKSINEAARTIGVNFQSIRIASLGGGARKGWRIYPSAENIRRQIALLEEQLKIVEG